MLTAVRENGATTGAGVLAEYSYNNLGQRTGVTYGNGTSVSFGYDSEYRMTQISHDINGTTDDISFTYDYSPAGQITSKVRSNQTYDFDEFANLSDNITHNGLNQILTNDYGTVTYNSRGSVTGAHGTVFSYDVWDNLTGTAGTGRNASFVYDPAGRLASVTDTSASETTQFLYSGTQLIAEYDGAGTLERRAKIDACLGALPLHRR